MQPSTASPAKEENIHPQFRIHSEWRKVPDGYPKDASIQLERD